MVKEAEREVRAEAEKREKDGKERLTRVINVQPSPGGAGENKKRHTVIGERTNSVVQFLPTPDLGPEVIFFVE